MSLESWKLKNNEWKLSAEEHWHGNIKIKAEGENLLIENNGYTGIELTYEHDFLIENEELHGLNILFEGENLRNGGGCLYINEIHAIPLNGHSSMELMPPINLKFSLKVPAQSSLLVKKISLELKKNCLNLTDSCSRENDILVITPDYPSTKNLYLCAFAHSRNREYVNFGLKVQVAAINQGNWYQTIYKQNNVSVFSGNYVDLKYLLSRNQYKVIVVHFVDEYLYPILDGYAKNSNIIFICHGPETIFRSLSNPCRPYFSKELPEIDNSEIYNDKEKWVKKYANRPNVDWVFVSEWLQNRAEQLLNTKFHNVHVIYNTINERLFPYHKKNAEDRKKILVIRKFDNISQHAIDQVVSTIQELSHRDFFNQLTFDIYGDGNYYDVLTAPLKKYSNVILKRTFVPNEQISKIHASHGILLIPSRHDAHAVAMSEGASSGLVVVGSNVTSNGYFMNNKINHTMAAPENVKELADIIERLYRNPDDFLKISERMAKETQEKCKLSNTVKKEIDLIKSKLNFNLLTNSSFFINKYSTPVLTIVVPAYNIELYIEKCLISLISHRNANKIEIIVVNDGSKDRTSEIAHNYEKLTNGIVKVIDKENGGHGSTINLGINIAKGKYFRLIDGDDWVDSENLAKLIDKLEYETVDLILTKGCYEYFDQAKLVNINDYDMLYEDRKYYFEDLLYPGYGFSYYGPLLPTSTYKTDVLKKANFKISEKKPYVDMEFNSFSLRYVETLKYWNLDIYRYLIGREGQTVSHDFWKKKYKDHEYVIFNVLETINSMDDFSETKRRYVYEHLIAQMIDSQIFMFDQLCLWSEIDKFLKHLKDFPLALEAGVAYIKEKNGDCAVILQEYHNKLEKEDYGTNPIIGNDTNVILSKENTNDHNNNKDHAFLRYSKKIVKMCVPYGVIRLFQKLKC